MARAQFTIDSIVIAFRNILKAAEFQRSRTVRKIRDLVLYRPRERPKNIRACNALVFVTQTHKMNAQCPICVITIPFGAVCELNE